MAEKTSLEKSHSKASNAKLTLICFLAALAVSVLWVGIAFIGSQGLKTLGIIMAAAGAVVTVLCILLIGKFSRG